MGAKYSKDKSNPYDGASNSHHRGPPTGPIIGNPHLPGGAPGPYDNAAQLREPHPHMGTHGLGHQHPDGHLHGVHDHQK